MARLTLRVELERDEAVGPGKVRLLELIAEHGSIAAAGRAMNMSYRRAWLLVDELNRMFARALVAKTHGGAQGGGAALTALGREVIARYRAIERIAESAAAPHLRALQGAQARRARRRESAAG
jgi:molybdate transport system regulatory protein